ncbi:hypothetical protein DWU98_02560 [Dyella monticola]|uniref:J domain-containing protein n=1 Tax=Dyella monticola TaxID=1927958 RepID=A0A370XA04_9GAMM|nr:hypothetical protein DWU98_02560 [Dyella monticola]
MGIPVDADAVTIKRAYARLLRTTRPDDDAAAFQRLNTAYQLTLSQANNRPTASGIASATTLHSTRDHALASEPAAEPRSLHAPLELAEVPKPLTPPASTSMEVLKLSPSPAPAPGAHTVETLHPPSVAKPISTPAPLEVLKPSAPAATSPPPALETLRPPETIRPPLVPAPLEVLKPASPAPTPAARPVEILRPPAAKPTPAVNTKELVERVIREASGTDGPHAFSRWLNHYPEFWSFQVKQVVGQLTLQHLLQAPQPMATANLEVLLRFFDLDHVLSGVNPIALEQLKNKQTLYWEMQHDHSSLARRLGIATKQGRPHTIRVRDCINELKQPRSWRQTFVTALTRHKPLHLARIVYALCNGHVEHLPFALDREHARFWFRAAGVSGFHWQRLTINAIRAVVFALVCSLAIAIPMIALSLQNGDAPAERWGRTIGVFFASFGVILLIWAALMGAAWIDQWQGQAEATASRKPWLRRMFIPLLSALGLGVDYLGGAPVAASIIVGGTMILAVRRFTYRRPKRPSKPAFKIGPRPGIYVLLMSAYAIGNALHQAPGGAFDDVPLLGIVSAATLLVWGIDLWRHRAYLHPKLARG